VPFRVALTFDAEHPDRPHAGSAAAVLDQLDRADIPATFFLQGRWVEAEPVLARRVRDAGHLIGSHSHYHARMGLFSPAGFRTDIAAADAVIRQHVRVDPKPWFRLPFGASATDARRVAMLAELGYRHVGWHVEPKEWRTRATAKGVAANIVDGARAHGDGAIVLLHTWPRPVPKALSIAILGLIDAGATFVRLDQLDLQAGLEPIAEPRPDMAAGA
jgi:peptidoglycan/xylan/chitin deacetylase (PgdA/CDA1 family)